ncbi:IclR family transcriptional regulator [Deinococcus yavapaiensis]|uniref:IclR family transcriptional regulator n=1 Tax=Deinococcus yavapaiensis KR-236 TaxID=694435 RepID=A0A318S2E6_9DEIO|nr:IclR family transcriptional regulator [Deinococcus yavapaiensis]PYE52711.1 IclR family transcriptional regulator [Deinococcus yavapaiensis KR-236]
MPKSSPLSTTRPYNIAALESAIHILELVGHEPGLRLQGLVERSGLNKSHVFRILRNLQDHALVWQDDVGAYRLGQAAYLLGKRAESQWSLTRAARRTLDDLSAATHENVHLVVRDDLHSVVVDLRESPHPIRMYAAVGRIGPLHAGGTPKVLLAYAGEDVLRRVLNAGLPSFTAHTTADPAELRAVLDDIRREGSHVAIADLEDGTFSIAAPIFDHEGRAVAAVSVAGPLLRFDDERRGRYRRLVVEAARRISRDLGFKP